jgi:chemotaxis protein methyltransferase CheR
MMETSTLGRTRNGAAVTLELSEAEFLAISARIHRDTGIVIGRAKRSMLISRLAHRLRHLGMKNFEEYIQHLEGPEGQREHDALVSAITTNVTSFFRESHHFDALAQLARSWSLRAKVGGRVRLWSAGCSTGQEAYSIAATLLDSAPDLEKCDLRILATDIDANVIEKAKAGVFDRRLIGEKVPAALARFLQDGPSSGQVTIAPKLRSFIRFEVLNLLQPWPFQGKFDVIFCRNVVIYFDEKTRYDLWHRLAGRVVTDGTLFIGHSERMDSRLESLFSPGGITQYRRTALSDIGNLNSSASNTSDFGIA